MATIYANDIGGIGVALASQQAQRDAASRQAMANLMLGLGRMQAQQNFQQQNQERSRLATQELAQRQLEREGGLKLQERKLKLDEDYTKWIMSQPTAAGVKEDAAAEKFALQKLVDDVNADGSLDTDSTAFKKAHPLVQQTLLAAATDRQKELKPQLDRRLEALKLANTAARMEAVADGISSIEKPSEGLDEDQKPGPFNFRVPDWLGGARSNDPKLIAADLKSKAQALKAANAKLLEEAGLSQDSKTKHFSTQFPAWYKEAASRQLRMALPPTAATATTAAPPPLVTNVTPNIVTPPPPPMTGTNRPATPRYQKQGGVWFELQPDGSYAAVVK